MDFRQFIRDQWTQLPLPNESDFKGGIYVVTGANTGLGFEAAQHLVRLNASRVILAVRSLSRGEAAQSRISAQSPLATKVAQADFVIDNSGSQTDLERNALAVLEKLRAEAGWTWRLTWLIPPLAIVSAFVTLLWRHVARKYFGRK